MTVKGYSYTNSDFTFTVKVTTQACASSSFINAIATVADQNFSDYKDHTLVITEPGLSNVVCGTVTYKLLDANNADAENALSWVTLADTGTT